MSTPTRPTRGLKEKPKKPQSTNPRQRHPLKAPFKGRPKKVEEPCFPPTNLPPDDIRNYVSLPIVEPPIRQSFLKDLVRCCRYAFWRYRANLQPKGYRRAPEIGTLFHLAVAAHYRGLDLFSVAQDVSAATTAIIARMRGEAAERNEDPGHVERVTLGIERDAALAIVMSEVYLERFPIDFSKYKVVGVEKTCLTRLPNGDHLKVTIDLILRGLERDEYFILDHKTTSQNLEAFRAPLGYDVQTMLYRIALHEGLKDGSLGLSVLPITGAVHNLMTRPSIIQKHWQSFGDYKQEVEDWYAGRDDALGVTDEAGNRVCFKSGPRKGQFKPRWEHSLLRDTWVASPPCQRVVTKFTTEMYSDELMSILEMGSRAAKCTPTFGNFPRTGGMTGMCHNHFGRVCDFHSLCTLNHTYWDQKIRTDFIVPVPQEESSADDA